MRLQTDAIIDQLNSHLDLLTQNTEELRRLIDQLSGELGEPNAK